VNHLLVIFIAGYCSTFLLGFQSRNVNHGNYGWAACTSFMIAQSSMFLWGTLFKDLSTSASLVYGLSGASGITSSMYVHRRWFKKGPDR
jgi:hypothetical protein